MTFEFAAPTRIVFGDGEASRLGALAREFGRRAFVVTGTRPGRFGALFDSLQNADVFTATFTVAGEPTVDTARAGTEAARAARSDCVIAIGGGAAIDAGKAIAALLANPGDPLDYLEVIGKGRPLAHAPVPFIAVPTTAGTGAEATRNAVLGSPEHRVKVSMRSALMLPRIALVDPLLTHSCPMDVTAASGLDAITQLLEAFVSCRANPMTDAFCREGLARGARALPRVLDDGHDAEARHAMAFAALLGGLALANAGLGAVHGFAGPIGGMYPGAPHGALCARLLPFVMRANIAALNARRPGTESLARYGEIARIITNDPNAQPADGVAWAARIAERAGIPGLATHGITSDHLPEIVDKARRASSMKGNPLVLEDGELLHLLREAL
ncbi:MAG: hypothetical protein PWP23_1413 [Candidatus Sumerlaeota bacterium]|nr:hypothetical protein [Candidatus Sumerlaeota bacterium]